MGIYSQTFMNEYFHSPSDRGFFSHTRVTLQRYDGRRSSGRSEKGGFPVIKTVIIARHWSQSHICFRAYYNRPYGRLAFFIPFIVTKIFVLENNCAQARLLLPGKICGSPTLQTSYNTETLNRPENVY